MIMRAEVIANSYIDSVRLLEATRAMRESPGVDWAWALMATPANLETLTEEGLTAGLEGAAANDLVLAVRGAQEHLDAALLAGRQALFTTSESGESVDATDAGSARTRPAGLDEALAAAPASNVVIVSVPGPYAALEAHKALTRDLDVLLFSDNVPLSDEIDLKRRARSQRRLVMGPGAGTAMLAGVGLGFSNRVARGPVGVVAAAGTGAQEVMTLLDRWGSGVSHVIGVGGRDLSSEVGGIMASAAMEALDHHDETGLTLLVSKPPAPAVAERLLGRSPNKPVVAALIGLDEPVAAAPGVTVCNTLEQAVVESLARLGNPGPLQDAAHPGGALPTAGTAQAGGARPDPVGSIDAEVARLTTSLSPRRQRLVGLFSGGTLAYEAMTIVSRHIGPVISNTPLRPSWARPGPAGAHLCLDLGEEEFTRGRPHPMIDPEARIELMRERAADDTVAAVLLDVVIGDGAHDDPASILAPAAAELVESGAAVVAYVLGARGDPQGFERQRSAMRQAGCVVTETAARAALAAAALVNRDPALVHLDLSASLTA